jgi:hypothetical protein
LEDDSILFIKPVAIGKAEKVFVGNPIITAAFTNISPAGKPIVVNVKVPEKNYTRFSWEQIPGSRFGNNS